MKAYNPSYSSQHQAGQIIIILLLIMVIGLTIGLSITSRTLQQLKMTTVTTQSSRAFTAAEAAIEEALRQDLAALAGKGEQPGSLGDVNFTYKVETPANEAAVNKDDVLQLDLEGWGGAALTICWRDDDAEPERPSLEIIILKESNGDYSLVRYAVNPVDRPENGFLNPQTGVFERDLENRQTVSGDCGTFENHVIIDEDNDVGFDTFSDAKTLRIRPFYSNAYLKVVGPPLQIYTVEGTGTAPGDVTRKVKVSKTPARLPPIFDYVIFDGSGNALKK